MSALGAPEASSSQSNWWGAFGRSLGWFAATLLVIFLIDGPRIGWLDWEVTPTHNINLAEAMAWRAGTFELAGPQREAARFGGRSLNAFPPGFSFISYAVLTLTHLFTGEDTFPPWVFRILIALPIAVISFWAARTCTNECYQASILTVCFLLGTPMLVMLSICRIGGFFEVNHVLACCGILLIVGDVLGRRRVWPALIGFALAFWTRQLTIIYFPAVVWAVLNPQRLGTTLVSQDPTPSFPFPPRADPHEAESRGGKSVPATGRVGSRSGGFATLGRRGGMLALTIATIVFVLGVYGVLNWAKFGSPWETGYRYLYERRTDPIAARARLGLFRPEYVPENLHYMMFEPPGVRVSAAGVERAMNDHGASIWLTCPILLAVVLTTRQWWRDRARRMLMLLSFGVVLMLLMYHNTGWRQPGYYRFSLDFVPVWLMVVAPYVWGRWRTVVVLACIAWSVWYFRFITFNNLAWAGLAG